MHQQISIFVVEDEPAIRTGLTDFLEFHDFQVTVASDGLEAQRLLTQNRFDLILLDLMLPKISGEQLCRQWRQEGLQTPIIMVTAKGRENERISGLNLGADDYVTKPFSLEELLARIRAILRRLDPARSVGQTFGFGDLDIDTTALKARRDQTEIALRTRKTLTYRISISDSGRLWPFRNRKILTVGSRRLRFRSIDHDPIQPKSERIFRSLIVLHALSLRECRIIQYLAAHPRRIISRQELYEKVWQDQMTDLDTRTVDMHIAKLRSKIEPDSTQPNLIKTVRGVGYLYEPHE